MIYRHHFQVRAPLSQVASFHSRANSMAAITPPPIIIQMNHTPTTLAEGDEMDFTMWIGPFPLRWLARIEAVTDRGFTDRQLRGPFAEWVHCHTFAAADEQTTNIIDEITLHLQSNPLWRLVGLGMRLGLPVLFAYRAWKTRYILQGAAINL